ncbi:MAG: extracellular solute-binding protein [Melioribacteraceae bacterium]|nr:extracellular solute-binding protein [Melioribacteraceae bacterium]
MIKKIFGGSRTFYFSLAATTVLVASVLLIMFFYGFGIFDYTPTVRKIYFADNISPTHRYLINKFNQLHKDKIEVVPIDLPFEKFSTNERKELLIRYLRSKSDRIDIFSVDHIWVPRFAKWTEPLDKYLTPKEKNELNERVLQTCYFQNKLVAIPLYFDISLLYYNNEQINKLPNALALKSEINNFITWERFIELSTEMKKSNKPVYIFPADDYEGLMCSFIELLHSQNGNLFDADSVNLQTEKAVKSLQLLVDLVNKYKITPPSVLSYRESESYFQFINDGGYFLRGWTGLHVWYKNNIKDEDVRAEYNFAPMPHLKGSKPASVIGGWNLMLSKQSTKKNEAAEFIKFLISEESQIEMFEKGGYLPVINSLFDNDKFISRNPEINHYKKIIETGVNRPFSEKYTRCSDVIAHYLNQAIKKEITVKEALATAERVINSGQFFIK